jgi:hypothetical protein
LLSPCPPPPPQDVSTVVQNIAYWHFPHESTDFTCSNLLYQWCYSNLKPSSVIPST